MATATREHLLVRHRAARGADHAEPPGEAERALARADGRADRGARGGRRRRGGAGDRDRRRRPGVLGRARPRRDGRPRRRLLRAALRRLHGDDGDDPSPPAAGDRQGARHRDRGRLPARRRLRPRASQQTGTRFATPGVKIGLFCSTPMVPLSRAVGRKRALEMLLTGEPIDAKTACEWGLINRRRAGRGARRRRCSTWSSKVARSSPLTLRIGKRGVLRADRPRRARRLRADPRRDGRERAGRTTRRRACLRSSRSATRPGRAGSPRPLRMRSGR